MLSHDLFEGLFARAALATDIELFEAFPAHYEAAAARQHRWARGDWQLLPWLFGRAYTGSEPSRAVVIPGIGRWKILDNLRRTLVAPTAFLTLIVGWILPEQSAWVWSGFILITIATPALFSFVLGLYPRRSGIDWRSHFRGTAGDLILAARQILLNVTFLVHQAWLMTDAILRTLVRLLFTHRRMLEWVTAAQAEAAYTSDLTGMYRRMVGAVALAFMAAGGMAVLGAMSLGLLRPRSCCFGSQPRYGPVGQPAASRGRGWAGVSSRCADAPLDWTPDLAVFRNVRFARGPCASA